MPRIRATVNAAAGAAETTAHLGSALLRRIMADGIDVDLVVPDAVRAKLRDVPLIGMVLVPVLDALDGIELHVDLGKP